MRAGLAGSVPCVVCRSRRPERNASTVDGYVETKAFERITIDPGQMRVVPSIRRLRIPVTTVLGQLAAGVTSEAILVDFPDLEPADISRRSRGC